MTSSNAGTPEPGWRCDSKRSAGRASRARVSSRARERNVIAAKSSRDSNRASTASPAAVAAQASTSQAPPTSAADAAEARESQRDRDGAPQRSHADVAPVPARGQREHGERSGVDREETAKAEHRPPDLLAPLALDVVREPADKR